MNASLPTAMADNLDQILEFIYSLEKYVAPTVILVPGFMKEKVLDLSDTTGIDVDTLDYALGLFLCYPLGLIMLALPFGRIRHIFSFLLGAFLLQFTLGVGWIHQLITSLFVYVMCLVLSPKTLKMAVPIFVMSYMTLGHLHRQYINYLGYDFDFTGTQMVITQKLYMLAYNLYDGQVLATGGANRASKKCSKFALRRVPGLVEYLGYTFCFSNVLTGPASEFSTYCSACDGSLFYTPYGKPRGKIPSNVWPTLRPLFISLVSMAIYVGLGSFFPILDPVDPQNNLPVIITPEFLQKPIYARLAYLWIALIVWRQKYFFAWKNSEGANNLWYAGFEGFDDDGNVIGWDNSSNIDIYKFETAANFQTATKTWNKKTSLWLTRYVYIRTEGSLVAVYSMSAFWHGFYPGYYVAFATVALFTICERLGRKKISPRFSADKWTAYDTVCRTVTFRAAEYLIIPFVVLALDRSIMCWESVYYIGHILAIAFFIIVSQLPTPKKKEE